MIASLPMYDRPETRAANDMLWKAIRAELGHGPASLDRTAAPWIQWRSPDLLLSQTCGHPYRARLREAVALVAAPDYGLRGCPAGHYRSVFVARADDARPAPEAFAEARFAYNEPLSHSGWVAPQAWAAQRGFVFANTLRTGAHIRSARAVASGRADIASLDLLSWEMMRRHDGFAAGLREAGMTPPVPAPPYVTSARRDPNPIAEALSRAIGRLDPEAGAALSLRGLVRLSDADYAALPTPPPGCPGSRRADGGATSAAGS